MAAAGDGVQALRAASKEQRINGSDASRFNN
jgi:hypothetical protein